MNTKWREAVAERNSAQEVAVLRKHIGVNLAHGTMKGTVRDGANSVRSLQI